jgi:hypothetical protein
MDLTELAKIVFAVLGALGGGGAIVVALYSWLGKLWAERLMEKEKALYQKDLEHFKAQLNREMEEEKARYQKDLEHFKAQLNRESDRTGQTLREKLSLYKEAIAPIVDIITQYEQTPTELKSSLVAGFEKKRLATSALLGMFAAMPVFEAYNALIDYLFDCVEGKRPFLFTEFRAFAFKLLSEIRRDVGISEDELVYRGPR